MMEFVPTFTEMYLEIFSLTPLPTIRPID